MYVYSLRLLWFPYFPVLLKQKYYWLIGMPGEESCDLSQWGRSAKIPHMYYIIHPFP